MGLRYSRAMLRLAPLILGLYFLILPYQAQAGQIPRFASLKSEETNLRAGPGTQCQIKWGNRRQALPVEIIDEYDYWRNIRDVDGEQGWVHKGLLSGARTAVITGEIRTLRRKPAATSAPALKAEPMVVGKLLQCAKE